MNRQFSSWEAAAEFWDTHDTADYPEAFRTVKLSSEFRARHYEIEIAPDVLRALRVRAKRQRVTLGQLASSMLRSQLIGTRP